MDVVRLSQVARHIDVHCAKVGLACVARFISEKITLASLPGAYGQVLHIDVVGKLVHIHLA